jgi:hypothetical protein
VLPSEISGLERLPCVGQGRQSGRAVQLPLPGATEVSAGIYTKRKRTSGRRNRKACT